MNCKNRELDFLGFLGFFLIGLLLYMFSGAM